MILNRFLHPKILFLTALSLSFLLGACITTPDGAGVPTAQMTFAHLEPLVVSAAQLSVVNDAEMISDPDVPFVLNPSARIEDYLRNRFTPEAEQGVSPKLRAIIEKVQLDYFPSGKTFFGGEPHRYRLKAEIVLEGLNHSEYAKRTTVISAAHNFSISQKASVAERERQQLEAFEAFIQKLDPKVIEVTRQKLNL